MSGLPQTVRIYSFNNFHHAQSYSQDTAVIPRDILEGVDSIIVQSWINMVRECGLYSKGLMVVRNGLLPIWAVRHRLNFHRHFVRVFFCIMVGSRITDVLI